MERQSVFTFTKKYSLITLIIVIFLAGCGSINEPINADTEGFFNHFFVYNFSLLIKGMASFLNGSYGLSIILITLIIRLAVMPFMLKQTRSSLEMQDKMKELKPEMDEIQNKYKDKKDKESQMKMQQEMMQLYQKHNFNPLASMAGCLPLVIQMPILIAFYYAIRRTPEIAAHQFLWFDLGQTDILLTILAVVIYFVQFRVSQIGLDPKQKKQMAIFGMLSPIMIGVISLSAPAALPLYWAVGGLFIIGQTLISKKIYLAHKKKTAETS
ncbi:membrane protein insertase YidC [Lentibacillus salicampi]|uniref:Membrane protein insertase YidC n=1 Tax=Lentibacillus salicampi TaxID=175306 RepID=A0A4Y9A7Y9_9BACI|nr:membrane protein insertase YidC [Lentibacillus salicampi]TFJ91899.1 membrane protein insertase YidC [Lentibacillus salicampi]